MLTFDCFLFFNELDLLDLRLKTINDEVDFFVIVESTLTFSGKPKKLYFDENQSRFKDYKKKIIHYMIKNDDNRNMSNALINDYFTNPILSLQHKHEGQPLSILHESIRREVFQRDSLIIPLIEKASQNDLVLLSDIDEIPTPIEIKKLKNNLSTDQIYHFRQKWYMYWINNRCNHEWFGTRGFNFAMLKGRSFDQMRYHTERRDMQTGIIIENGGWHFSYLGGSEKVREKLDALAYQGKRAKFSSLLNSIFTNRLNTLINKNDDILFKGRRFSAELIDESFPAPLVEAPDLLKHYRKV